MLRVEQVTKRYGSNLALDRVDLEVRSGQVTGFLGPNGAGKTTTMRAIMGLVHLDSGRVTWNGCDVDAGVRREFGYMPAERGMYQRMKVREHLQYYGRMCGMAAATADAAVDGWLERLELTGRADDTVQSLSSGNQQRVQLALALLNEPDLLVLDEPFSGLDPIAVEMLSGVLEAEVRRGAALLLSSHQLDLVAGVCTDVVIVDRGRVVLRGDVAELRRSSGERRVEVEFSVPTSTDWAAGHEVAVSGGDRRHRVAVPAGAAPDELVERAQRAGEVLGYSFAPPDLSEVFLRAVGRTTVETGSAEHDHRHGHVERDQPGTLP